MVNHPTVPNGLGFLNIIYKLDTLCIPDCINIKCFSAKMLFQNIADSSVFLSYITTQLDIINSMFSAAYMLKHYSINAPINVKPHPVQGRWGFTYLGNRIPLENVLSLLIFK